MPLNKRINVHRTSKHGCENFIQQFSSSCKKCVSIQIIEKFPSTGYNQSGKTDPSMRDKRLTAEDVWMKNLRTIFPYGSNERAKEINGHLSDDEPIGKIFPPLSRTVRTIVRSRNNRNC